ncbi:MAG: transcriptional regulator [Deltaproteobacteria bacterium RIFOXYD12_FULL_57_12]|nr:MAG: transcriptional regulator [Deltaproteobacteria bacterium RIFOXYD12_FULL_57_12]
MNFAYPVELIEDDNGTVRVVFPDVPEAITFGDDEDEALLRATEALETALSMYVDEKQDLPRPSAANGRRTVSPGAIECAKLGIYQAMRENQVRKTDLARRLGWHLTQIDRLLDLGHSSKVAQIEQAAAAMGKHLVMSIE